VRLGLPILGVDLPRYLLLGLPLSRTQPAVELACVVCHGDLPWLFSM
jgi:hypothetical protein